MDVSDRVTSNPEEPSATEGNHRLTGVAECTEKNSATIPPNPEVEAKGGKRAFFKSY